MIRKPFYLLILLLGIASCSNDAAEIETNTTTSKTSDSHSYANVDEIHTTHLHLDLDVNFDNQTIYGVARHEMSAHNVKEAIFDIKGLDIQKVTIGTKSSDETAASYKVGESDALLGAPLSVSIDQNTRFINIYYKTTEETEAIDWLPAHLTEGKKHPFMYTQGQAILTRSWIPLQDTPMNRITYSADVQVPSELLPVMSASNPTETNVSGNYHFEMQQPIPAYLIALAVGNLKYTSLGEKCGVYTEPELAQAAAYEFVDVPKMMVAAEGLYGDYQWEQFDMVILPYSFPFGGMENPRLTFANPTLLAGDRSLVSVIAHELAHSWSGNLVTNATWNDFWLNEGFTVYFENRIMEELYGKEVADILAIIEFQDLEVSLDDLGTGEHPEDTKLKLELEGRSPDDGMTDIAYIKGAYFLRTLEQKVGREILDVFLTKYFESHAFQTITTEDFEVYLKSELLEPNKIEFNTQEWIYGKGLPSNCHTLQSERLKRMQQAAYYTNREARLIPPQLKGKKREDFITQEWQTYIRSLESTISVEVMEKLDTQFQFSEDANPAIKSDWYQLCIKTGYTDARPAMKAYLCRVGRRWFIESIYQCLVESNHAGDKAFANEVFETAKTNYHFVSRSTIEGILNE